MIARSVLIALVGISGLALTACSSSSTVVSPATESTARAVETAVNQELTDYLASPEQRDAFAEFFFGNQETNSLRESIIDAANMAAGRTPGATATVEDLPGGATPPVPTAFEVAAAGSEPWCVIVQQPAWTSLIQELIEDSTATPPGNTFSLYKAAAGDCAAWLKLYEEGLASQTEKADLAAAQADGAALSKQITMLLIDATNMGTTPPNISTWATLDGATGDLTLTPGAGAEGIVTSAQVSTSTGTTITASGMMGGPVDPATGPIWCIAVGNNGRVAVYTETGLQPGKDSCTMDGMAVGPVPMDLAPSDE